MANLAVDDLGFQGRLFPQQRAKLRQYFCLNPWPGNPALYQIAAEIGAPVLVVANYYNYVRSIQPSPSENFLSQTYQTEQQYVGLSAETFQRLDQYLLLDANPSFQAITNIARELSIPRRMVEQYFDEKVSKEDDLDNLLDEMLESPSGIRNPGAYSRDIVERTSSQDELMRALSEVGLSTGQMNKFSSELSQGSENPVEYPLRTTFQPVHTQANSSQLEYEGRIRNQQFLPNQGNGNNSVILINQRGSETSAVSYGAQMSSTNLSGYHGHNQFVGQNAVLHNPSLTRPYTHQPPSQVYGHGQASGSYPCQQIPTNIPSQNQAKLPPVVTCNKPSADIKDHYATLDHLGAPELFTEYEVMKDVEQLPQHLFHQYMQPGGSSDFAKIKSELSLEALDMELSPPISKSSQGQLVTKQAENNLLTIKSESLSGNSLSPTGVALTKADSDLSFSFDQVSSYFGSSQPVSTPAKAKYVKKKKSSTKPTQELSSPKLLNMSRKRNSRCKVCASCLAKDCEQCVYCLDKPKFGGPNKKKNACLHRRCVSMVKLSPTKSFHSNHIVTPLKNTIPKEYLSQALDDMDNIPFEIEGYPETSQSLPVNQNSYKKGRGLTKVISNNPIKRQIQVEDLSVKKIKLGTQLIKAVGMEIKKESLAIVRYQITDKVLIEEDKLEKCTSSGDNEQDLLKTRLHALRFDHCYSHRVEYFEGIDNEIDANIGFEGTGQGSLLKYPIEPNINHEVAPSLHIQEVQSCSEIEDKLSCDEDFNENEYKEDINIFETEENYKQENFPYKKADDDQIIDESESEKEDDGSFNAYLKKKMAEFKADSDVLCSDDEDYKDLHEVDQKTLKDTYEPSIKQNQDPRDLSDTEELLTEEYDELDSLEKKEIEEQLSGDFLGNIKNESILDESETLPPTSSFDFDFDEESTLLPPPNTKEKTVFNPVDFNPQVCFNPENVKAEFSFQFKEVRNDELGSDGDFNSSPENSPSTDAPFSPESVEPQGQGTDFGERRELAYRVEDEGLHQEERQDGYPLYLAREHGHEHQVCSDGVHEAVWQLCHGRGGEGD